MRLTSRTLSDEFNVDLTPHRTLDCWFIGRECLGPLETSYRQLGG